MSIKHNLLDLLSKFGYTLETIKDTNKKLLTKEDIEKIMINILDTKWFDKNKKLLFGMSKSNIARDKKNKNNENNYSVKSFMGTINTIISNYGLKMISKKKTIG